MDIDADITNDRIRDFSKKAHASARERNDIGAFTFIQYMKKMTPSLRRDMYRFNRW